MYRHTIVYVVLLWSLLDKIHGAKLPNIVVIVCDSMDGRLTWGGRYDEVVDLPNLRKLSERGITYQNAYSNSPVCVPSRSALWSGMYTHITETWNNNKGLPLDFHDTWEDRLRERGGYETKILGVVDNRAGAHSVSNRVEAWTRNVNFTLRQEGRPTVKLVGNESTTRIAENDWKVVDKAVDYIKSKNTSSWANLGAAPPFLLYVGVRSPHPYNSPFEGENAGDSTFKTSPYWLKKVDKDGIKIPPWLPKEKMHPVDLYSTIVKNCSSDFTKQELLNIKTYFYAMCAETDAMVGVILDALDQTHLSDSTYIIFSSDHGELAMEHRQFYKMSMYEGSAHVPLILSYPLDSIYHRQATSKEKNPYDRWSFYKLSLRLVENPVSLIDVYPTLLDIAKLDTPGHLNGSSLFSPDGWYVLSQFHGSDVNASTYMLRLGPWKYLSYDFGEPKVTKPQLFNLQEDPDELSNVANKYLTLVNDFDAFLREKIDYPSVTQKVRQYNRESFITWRDSQGSAYDDIIANLRWWKDWQKAPEKNQKAINNWLASGIGRS